MHKIELDIRDNQKTFKDYNSNKKSFEVIDSINILRKIQCGVESKKKLNYYIFIF